jgi:hypothetical protein
VAGCLLTGSGAAAAAGRSKPQARHFTAGCAHHARIWVSAIIRAVSPTFTFASTDITPFENAGGAYLA